MRIIAWLSICGVLISTAGSAEETNPNSGSAGLSGCIAFVQTDLARNDSFFDSGVCAGQMHALLTLSTTLKDGFRFCAPSGTTNGQAAKVVVRFLNDHRKDLDRNFFLLAVTALREEFPCRQGVASAGSG